MMSFNWITLFEAYRYTTVATATLCYYTAPIFVTLASPLLLKERLTARKLFCVCLALAGMVFVSGVPQSGLPGPSEARGILLALCSAALYAGVILLNKYLSDVPAYDRTVLQLAAAAVVMEMCIRDRNGVLGQQTLFELCTKFHKSASPFLSRSRRRLPARY